MGLMMARRRRERELAKKKALEEANKSKAKKNDVQVTHSEPVPQQGVDPKPLTKKELAALKKKEKEEAKKLKAAKE